MKKVNYTFLFLSIACTLCGCNNTSDSNNQSSSSNDEWQGNIVIALPSSGTNKDLIDNAIIEYNKLRPNVNVQIDYKTTNDFYLSYKSDITNKFNYPDAAFIDHVYIQTLAASNLIAPVDISDVKDLYVDNIIEANALNNTYYGFPFSANTICLFYNKDIIGDNKVPETYEEFLQVGQTIYNKEISKTPEKQNKVFSLPTGNQAQDFGTFILTSWIAREGGNYLSNDLKTSCINSNEFKKAISKWKEIIDKGFANSEASNEDLFYAGKVAFIEMGCWKIPDLIENNTYGNFGVAPLFTLEENKEANSVLGLYSMCVTKQEDAKKMKLAEDFCKFISTNTKIQIAYAKDSKLLPVTKEACQDEYYLKPEWKVFIDAMPLAARRPGSPIWSTTIQVEVGNLITKVATGKVTVDVGVNTVHNKVQSKLDQLYK